MTDNENEVIQEETKVQVKNLSETYAIVDIENVDDIAEKIKGMLEKNEPNVKDASITFKLRLNVTK